MMAFFAFLFQMLSTISSSFGTSKSSNEAENPVAGASDDVIVNEDTAADDNVDQTEEASPQSASKTEAGRKESDENSKNSDAQTAAVDPKSKVDSSLVTQSYVPPVTRTVEIVDEKADADANANAKSDNGAQDKAADSATATSSDTSKASDAATASDNAAAQDGSATGKSDGSTTKSGTTTTSSTDAASNQVTAPDVTPITPTNASNVSASQAEPLAPEADETIDLAKASPDAIDVMTGRVHTFEVETKLDIESIEITELPDFGNVTVTPDNGLVLVLTGEKATGPMSFSYKVKFENGSVETHTTNLNVVEGLQADGWGLGEHYMLETDENGDVIVETGDVHRSVYVTESSDGLTRADIAALEGISEKEVTDSWLVDHPEYGGSEGKALATEVGLDLWANITDSENGPTSHWLLFERGFDYDGTNRIIGRGTNGEDELHPLHVTAWGSGEMPVLNDRLSIYQETSANIVFTDIVFNKSVAITDSANILFDDVRFTGEEAVIKGTDGLTIRNSEISDVFRHEDRDGDGVWEAHEDRISGLYVAGGRGTLIEGNLIDQNGWEEGGQPASQWSHNVYLQYNTKDVTFSNNVVMNGASFGAQLRGGAFAKDNVFTENNAAVNFVGGDYKSFGTIGNYTLFQDNIVTSPAFKDGQNIGSKGYGLNNNGELSVMVDNIIAHVAEPGNEEELADKWLGASAQYLNKDPLYNNTIVYNWLTGKAVADGKDWSVNAEGLDREILDQTTIQKFTALLLGKETATIGDLSAYLRAQADGEFDDFIDAELISAFFQTGFGISADIRIVETTVTFTPHAISGGVRWDNELNWSTEDIAGSVSGDSVDLAGNWVQYSGTHEINDFDFGSGGQLRVAQGKLTIDGETTSGDAGGTFNIEGAGQVWLNGVNAKDSLDINIDGGRFANTGELDGTVKITVEDGDAILATNAASTTLKDGSDLHIKGDKGEVGFDGTDGEIAILQVGEGGSVTFEAGEDGELGAIEEFSSGAFGDDSDVTSGVNIQDGTLRVALNDQTEAGNKVLIEADEIVGAFRTVKIAGLSDDQDVVFTVNYKTDKVALDIIDGGNGEATYDIIGTSDDADDADGLWKSLTDGMGTLDEAPPTIELFDDPETMLEI